MVEKKKQKRIPRLHPPAAQYPRVYGRRGHLYFTLFDGHLKELGCWGRNPADACFAEPLSADEWALPRNEANKVKDKGIF
jgi:hypothetical protein